MKDVTFTSIAIVTLVSCSPQDGSGRSDRLLVWWSRRNIPELTAPSDCDRLWRTWRPQDSSDEPPLVVEMTMPDGRKVDVKTCAEWDDCRERGGYPLTTYDITMDSWFSHGALLLSNLPHMTPSAQSAFAGVSFDSYALELTYQHRGLVGRGPAPSSPDTEVPSLRTEITPNRVEIDDRVFREFLDVIARGDYNGDGWEDLLISGMVYASQGSLRYPTSALKTKRGDGVVIDITPQLCERPTCCDDIARRRGLLRDSFGWPQGRVIEFVGTSASETDASPVAIRMELAVQHSIVDVKLFRGDQQTPAILVGCIGFDDAMLLHDVPGSGIQSEEWRLKWAFAGGGVEITGDVREGEDGFRRVALTGKLVQGSAAQD